MQQLDTVVIGGGQAGLTISYYLRQMGREHLILEKERVFKAWRDERWDSFTLVTPNWALQLPGMAYNGDDPDGFLTRQEVVDYLEAFVARFDPPVREGVEATAVEAAPGSEELIVRSSAGDFRAANVVVATGTYQRPKIPPFGTRLAGNVEQIHSSAYRNLEQLRPRGRAGGAQRAIGLPDRGRGA